MFKVGDEVVLSGHYTTTRNFWHNDLEEQEKGVIIGTNGEGDYNVELPSGQTWWFYKDDIKLAQNNMFIIDGR